MDIKLRFINHSDDGNQSEVLVYQKNLYTEMASLPIAWKVIRYCGYGCYHPFLYPTDVEVCVADSWGNFSPRLKMANGQALALLPTPTGGKHLVRAGKAAAATEVDVRNELEQGAVDVCVYRDGRLMGVKTSVAPGQKAVFQYQPTLWISVASQIEQGTPLNSAVMSDQHTELSLLGIASADIVMTGGGAGEGATPYQFRLDNITPL